MPTTLPLGDFLMLMVQSCSGDVQAPPSLKDNQFPIRRNNTGESRACLAEVVGRAVLVCLAIRVWCPSGTLAASAMSFNDAFGFRAL